MKSASTGIFLSYRRADSKAWTGRLADDLRAYFGRDRVFLDIDSSRAGQDFVVQIDDALASSRAVVAVIGPSWLEIADGEQHRRIDNPEDFVRQELEHALSSGIPVLTVLVGHATVPPLDQLPTSLKKLARVQAVTMADEDWEFHFGRLVEALEKHGLYAARSTEEQSPIEWKPSRAARYQRVVSASRRRAFDAVVATAEALEYKEHEDHPEAARVTFRAAARQVTVKILDGEQSTQQVVAVEFSTPKATVLGAGAVAVAVVAAPLGVIALGGWSALRLWERRFAKGFLENVQRVLEGKGVGENSALPPGVEAWLNRSPEV